MSAYKDALVIDATSSAERLALAAQALSNGEGIVLLEKSVALRPTTGAIMCDVIDPMPRSHRCAEEFRVLVENAKRALAASKLAGLLPNKPLQWRVVEDCGTGIEELWPEHQQAS